jgi:hypothetical protein
MHSPRKEEIRQAKKKMVTTDKNLFRLSNNLALRVFTCHYFFTFLFIT